ncbi:MAG: hypothetical protein J6S67_00115 [Methanobrevibacter sp.]|nr:hypothetical protein [Methanobrevibacter sp.]
MALVGVYDYFYNRKVVINTNNIQYILKREGSMYEVHFGHGAQFEVDNQGAEYILEALGDSSHYQKKYLDS